MKQFLLVCVVLAFGVTGCNRLADQSDQTGVVGEAAAPSQIEDDSQPPATSGDQAETAELPPTSSVLPLAGAAGMASLGGLLIVRWIRRRVR